MSISTTETNRAAFALECVKKARGENFAKEYKSYCRKFPSLILANGLAAAVSFVYAKKNGNNAYTQIHENVYNWLRQTKCIENDMELIDYIVSIDSATYRYISSEIITLFEWLRRFVDGMIEGDA